MCLSRKFDLYNLFHDWFLPDNYYHQERFVGEVSDQSQSQSKVTMIEFQLLLLSKWLTRTYTTKQLYLT